jgi:hypothetical protein
MEKPALNVSKEGDGFILTDVEGPVEIWSNWR